MKNSQTNITTTSHGYKVGDMVTMSDGAQVKVNSVSSTSFTINKIAWWQRLWNIIKGLFNDEK